ncbi:pyridoxal phosphate-dependent aminotransferase [Poritiphilus flavus]|uniref:Aminotransferase class I/II-fold pyridoxal phosphate-dependent enzyme n=1 Tax=Poritiphilus flavus TaxID=2697053 RepID=A0A6L9EFM6_9FLAO|nr:histidinol-phosphate transaminase [Poritiphilus flavus]NAS13079.1 aminotransferase class I/II-fold pyridoxal phosphate-dependent enzyme [Poritiphilus flavus]
MNTTDRRQWLKTFGLSSGFALLGGFESMALEIDDRPSILHRPAKLNANENPYGPSKRIRAILSNTFDEACRYPFAKLRTLVEAISEKEGVTKDHIVVCGGSTEGLRAAGMLYGMGEREIIAADPTFQALMRYAENFGAKVHRVPLNDKLQHDLEAMGQKINAKTGLVYICNPNNPTGTLLDGDKLKDFCSSFHEKAVIFSDEAYYDYIMEPDYPSMVEFIKEGHNIIVSKTFSKVFGLAGLRIGYLIAKPEIATKLKSTIMANTNILAIEAAKEALKDDSFYKFSLAKNAEAKKHIYQTLDSLSLSYIPSHTNFVFFKSGRPIDQLIAAMKEEEVIIGRPFPPLLDWARISTGTMPDMERFRKALSTVMSK